MRADEYEYTPKDVGDEISLDPGFYKTRLSRGGQYIPVEVKEICERDEAGHLASDVKYSVFAWPRLHDEQPTRWEYMETKPHYMRPIDEDEFKWMLILRTL